MSTALIFALIGALAAGGLYWYGENHSNNEPYGDIPLVIGFLAGAGTCVVSLIVAAVIGIAKLF